MNFQDDNGKAKQYQVLQLLEAIDGLPVPEEKEGEEGN
jgi:hypothetical protein